MEMETDGHGTKKKKKKKGGGGGGKWVGCRKIRLSFSPLLSLPPSLSLSPKRAAMSSSSTSSSI